jgi:hypothetical protein
MSRQAGEEAGREAGGREGSQGGRLTWRANTSRETRELCELYWRPWAAVIKVLPTSVPATHGAGGLQGAWVREPGREEHDSGGKGALPPLMPSSLFSAHTSPPSALLPASLTLTDGGLQANGGDGDAEQVDRAVGHEAGGDPASIHLLPCLELAGHCLEAEGEEGAHQGQHHAAKSEEFGDVKGQVAGSALMEWQRCACSTDRR